MTALRSLVANEIDTTRDAYFVGVSRQFGRCFHLPILGILHNICLREEDSNVGYFKDLRELCVKFTEADIYPALKFRSADTTSLADENMRKHQVDVFIALVLDVRRSGVSSIELAAPALLALLMLLKSHWESATLFGAEFLAILVSLLNSDDGTEIQSSLNYGSSACSIAEDIILTIIQRKTRNFEMVLDVIFSSLRGESSIYCSVSQTSILSQALGSYLLTALPAIIAHSVKKTSVTSECELLGQSKAKADKAWRVSLNLGDVLELNTYDEPYSWTSASIVKINHKTDTFTLEYRIRAPSALNVEGVPSSTAASQLLLVHVARSTSRIRPVPDATEGSHSKSRNTQDTSGWEDTQSRVRGIAASASEESHSELEDAQYRVTSNHRLAVGLVFNSMKLEGRTEVKCEISTPDDNSNGTASLSAVSGSCILRQVSLFSSATSDSNVYGISDIIELIVKLDKAKKKDMGMVSSSGELLRGVCSAEEEKENGSSVVCDLLDCAWSIFKRVSELPLNHSCVHFNNQ